MKIVWISTYNLSPFKDIIKGIKNHFAFAATWMTFLQEELSNRKDIELHIITVHAYSYIKKEMKIQVKPNVYIYVLNPILFLFKKYYQKRGRQIQQKIRYRFVVNRILKLIDEIKPDIVNSHGTEFLYSLPLEYIKIPKVVTIQGFINELIKFNNNPYERSRLKLENRVFRNNNNFIVKFKFMENIIKQYNKDANFFYHVYPINPSVFQVEDQEEVNDIIYAARITKDKGIEDVLTCLPRVVKAFPKVKFRIIGRSPSSNYENYLKKIIEEKGIQQNVDFIGTIEDHTEYLTQIKQSKICILPTYYDIYPGTLVESHALGVPVITYKVGGIPELLKNGYNGFCFDKGDINKLSETIIDLLDHPEKREYIAANAKKISEMCKTPNIVDKMLTIYEKIILGSKI